MKCLKNKEFAKILAEISCKPDSVLTRIPIITTQQVSAQGHGLVEGYTFFSSPVLGKIGANIGEIRKSVGKHVDNCYNCAERYIKFLDAEVSNKRIFGELNVPELPFGFGTCSEAYYERERYWKRVLPALYIEFDKKYLKIL